MGKKIKPKTKDGKYILYNGRTEFDVGNFIRLKGENFFRRVNSDGTLTKVEDGSNGTYDYKRKEVPSNVRNKTILNLGGVHGEDSNTWTNVLVNAQSFINNFTPEGRLANMVFDTPFVLNLIIRNTEGNSEGLDGLASILTGWDRGSYYDGKLHNHGTTPSRYYDRYGNSEALTTFKWSPNRNIVNLYTHQDTTGFEPSKLGIGSYKNTKYNKFPVYEGKFYNTDTLYLPIDSKKFFISNINKHYYQDHDKLIEHSNFGETDDVLHYIMTPRLIKDRYYIDFEDVWDIDRGGLNSRNYPFILNLRLPVVFTNDLLKLNIVPELSKWFSDK